MRDWDESVRARATIMREGLDLARLDGLEIGALSFPIIHRSDGPITYVDQTTTDALRHVYADDPAVKVDDIVEVDAVWGEYTLLDCLGGRRVDYIMASHVAEHVPDLITWLGECRSALKPGGQLRLVLPDSRFSHDARRGETRLSDLLAAWVLRARKPQIRDVLDFRLLCASGINGIGVFDGTADPADATPDVSFKLAVETAERVRDDPDLYLDVHCLVAQAGTFARLMEQIARAGLLQLACASMRDTAPPLFEYTVFMTRCDDAEQAAESWQQIRRTLHDPLPGSAARKQADDAERSRQALKAAETARAAAESELNQLRHSMSWQMTEPFRRVRARMRR